MNSPTHANCMYSAFFMEGLRDAGDYEVTLKIWNQGSLELVSRMVMFAPMTYELCCAGSEFIGDAETAGIFEYEVCGDFGAWFSEIVTTTGDTPDPEACAAKLVELVSAFYRISTLTPADQDRLKAKLEVTAEGAMP